MKASPTPTVIGTTISSSLGIDNLGQSVPNLSEQFERGTGACSLDGHRYGYVNDVKTILPSLTIATEKICFLIVKAREFDVKDAVTDPDDASNATDDSMISVLEDHGDDPARRRDSGHDRRDERR